MIPELNKIAARLAVGDPTAHDDAWRKAINDYASGSPKLGRLAALLALDCTLQRIADALEAANRLAGARGPE